MVAEKRPGRANQRKLHSEISMREQENHLQRKTDLAAKRSHGSLRQEDMKRNWQPKTREPKTRVREEIGAGSVTGAEEEIGAGSVTGAEHKTGS
jgi:hypothetical protein